MTLSGADHEVTLNYAMTQIVGLFYPLAGFKTFDAWIAWVAEQIAGRPDEAGIVEQVERLLATGTDAEVDRAWRNAAPCFLLDDGAQTRQFLSQVLAAIEIAGGREARDGEADRGQGGGNGWRRRRHTCGSGSSEFRSA